MKRISLLALAILLTPSLFAEQFSAQPHGLIGTKRTFVDAWFFNEGAGTTARGEGGNTGDLLSGPIWIKGLHGHALDFAATNSRVEIRNESNFDFMNLTGVWTIVFEFRAKKLLAGIIFSKTETFSADHGFYIQAESDATGDLAFVRSLAGVTAKWVTPVIPLAKVAGNRPHVLIIDYCYEGVQNTNIVKFFLDGVKITVTGNPTIGDITNDRLPVIAGWDAGTSASFNGTMDMLGVWEGDTTRPIALTEGDARAITARILGW